MGTWGTGPFDNDTAADFVDTLDGLSTARRVEAVEQVLILVAESDKPVNSGDGAEAVAAAALVADQVSGGRFAVDAEDGPAEPLPALPAHLRVLAKRAVERVLRDDSELTMGWVSDSDLERWHGEVQQIVNALDTTP